MSRGGGRGRGRGRGGGRLEAPGFAPGEPAPPPILQPPPLFPVLNRRPLDLRSSETEDYVVNIKHELKHHMMQSPFHLVEPDPHSFKITRYSDKYRRNGEKSRGIGWQIDWKYFPRELRVRTKMRTKKKSSPSERGGKRRAGDSEELGPPDPKKPQRRVTFDKDSSSNVLDKKLESLERAEQLSADSEQSGGEEEANVEDSYEEEEEEEGTDYNLTYFDNGEDYDVGEEDALEEGPVY